MSDIREIARYGILGLPGLVINGKINVINLMFLGSSVGLTDPDPDEYAEKGKR